MSTNALLGDALSQGSLSAAAHQVLTARNLGADIEAAMGIDAASFPATDVVLMGLLIDDSGSIRFGSATQNIRDGHNDLLDDFSKSAAKDDILIHNRYLNGTILYPFSPISGAIRMDTHNYDPNGGTPLYDQTLYLLKTMLTKTQEFEAQGSPVRTITIILTDGEDMHSRATADDVRIVVEDMLKKENHVIAAVGVGNSNFKQVFNNMGIPDEWILNPKDGKDVRAALGLVSQKSQQLATSVGSGFSKTAAGGFGQS